MTAKFYAQNLKTKNESLVTEINSYTFAAFDDFLYFVNRFLKENRPLYFQQQYWLDYQFVDD